MQRWLESAGLALLLLSGCGAAQSQSGPPTPDTPGEALRSSSAMDVQAQGRPSASTLAPAQADGEPPMPIGPAQALRRDAQLYAQDNGVALDEALRRLSLQEQIGRLGARLEYEAAETFAGLWIQHQPDYRVVVAFTRDGGPTIEPYVAGSELERLIEVRPAQISLQQLKDVQHQTGRLLQQAGLFFATSINVQQNQVEVHVTDPVFFEVTVEQTGLSLPQHVVALTVYEPLRDPPPLTVNLDRSVHFPQLKVPSAVQMAALTEGTLVLEQGCLLVRANAADPGHLIIWQPHYFLHRNGEALEILDRSGKPVARVGARVRVGGGEVRPGPGIERQLREPLPEHCAGPLWLMGELERGG